MSADFEVQTAIYDVLKAALTPIEIYDHVPENAAFPRVTFGRMRKDDNSNKSNVGHEIKLQLHIWSRNRGKKEAFDIIYDIEQALHEQTLTVTGYNTILLRIENSDVWLDEDGITRHGVVQVRAMIEEI